MVFELDSVDQVRPRPSRSRNYRRTLPDPSGRSRQNSGNHFDIGVVPRDIDRLSGVAESAVIASVRPGAARVKMRTRSPVCESAGSCWRTCRPSPV